MEDHKLKEDEKSKLRKKLEASTKEELNAYVIIAVLIILAVICTWIVPAGQYDRVFDEATNREIVAAGSYHNVEQTPVGIWEAFQKVAKGFSDANVIIFFILVVGGSFGLLTETGAITSMIAKAVILFKGKRHET